LIRKFHEAKVAHAQNRGLLGSGSPLREFLYSDDLARACVFLMQNYSEEQFINVGYRQRYPHRTWPGSCSASSVLSARSCGQDQTGWTPAKIDGQLALVRPRVKPQVDLETGIRLAYEDFLKRFSRSKTNV